MLKVELWHEAENIDGTEAYGLGEEYFLLDETERKGLFRRLQKEFGRCSGHVYQDVPDGTYWPIGWVFERIRPYADARSPKEVYRHRVWAVLRYVKEEE